METKKYNKRDIYFFATMSALLLLMGVGAAVSILGPTEVVAIKKISEVSVITGNMGKTIDAYIETREYGEQVIHIRDHRSQAILLIAKNTGQLQAVTAKVAYYGVRGDINDARMQDASIDESKWKIGTINW